MDHGTRTFIIRPWVSIGPVYELLVDPCEETYGRVCERVPDRLRLRGLLLEVAQPFLARLRCASKPRLVALGPWERERAQEREEATRVRPEARWAHAACD